MANLIQTFGSEFDSVLEGETGNIDPTQVMRKQQGKGHAIFESLTGAISTSGRQCMRCIANE